MRIGVDATCWANERGYGRFTRELVAAMAPAAAAHELVCFLDDRSADAFRLDGANVTRRVVAQAVSPTLAASSGSRRSIGDMLKMGNAVRRERVDVFFSPSVYGYFPLPPGLPAVVTIHDAIAERFPALTLPTRMDRWSWRAKVKLAIFSGAADSDRFRLRRPRGGNTSWRVTHALARGRRGRVGRVPVRVIRPTKFAPRPTAQHSGGRALADYVGGFGPHKHVDLIVRAHAEAARLNPGSPLVLILAGPNQDGFHADVAGIRDAIRECGTESLVRWAGFLPDEELRHLHSGAVALLLVSASEGFGLPAVEAAMCGAPVVATTESPLPQLLEGGGVFVAPGDVTAITAGITRLLADEPARAAMGRRARERAQELSWARAATVTLGALEEVAAPRRKVA
jgi:glycosyltransferase involved in cell wall biosynthesis